MATKYATNATEPARAPHTGAVTVKRTYVAGGETLSAGDVIEFMRVPHGALIVDYWFSGNVPATALHGSFGFGTGTDSNVLATSLTGSADLVGTTVRADDLNTAWKGYKVSVSDEAVYDWRALTFSITAATSATSTGTLVMCVTYTLDGE